jgi:hypothetical protein
MSTLRNNRLEIADAPTLELQADQGRADMAYLEVTMRLFDPNFEPEISTDTRARNDWFRPGE